MARKVASVAHAPMAFTGIHPGGGYSVYAPLTAHGPLPIGWRWYSSSQTIILLPIGTYLVNVFVDGADQMRLTHFRPDIVNAEYEVSAGGDTLQDRSATFPLINEHAHHGILLRGPNVTEGRKVRLTIIRTS